MKTSAIDLKISQILNKMGKAMPEVRRQVEVYERNVKLGLHTKPPRLASKFKNV